MTQFDLFKARAERDAAMASVDANANERWKAEALAVITRLAQDHGELTSDDVMIELGKNPRIVVHDPRALGPVMLYAVKLGIIEKTGQYQQSIRRHATPIPIWRKRRYSP